MKKPSQSSEKKIVRPFAWMLCVISMLTSGLSAQDRIRGRIVQVARNLAMTNAETPPKDLYIDVGNQDGVRVGQDFAVHRVHLIMSELTGEPIDFVRVPLGRIRVITVGPSASISRILATRLPERLPKLEYPVMMTGDRVELLEPFAENPELMTPPLLELETPS